MLLIDGPASSVDAGCRLRRIATRQGRPNGWPERRRGCSAARPWPGAVLHALNLRGGPGLRTVMEAQQVTATEPLGQHIPTCTLHGVRAEVQP